MITTIENKIILDNISSDRYIDHLVLKNNFYSNDINLGSLTIGKLEINNINKYQTKFFDNIIDRVIDGGKMILKNMVLDRLDCSRFDSIKLKGCIIFELIKGECEVEYNMTSNISNNFSYCENIHYVEGIYDGIYNINEYNGIYRNFFGTMRYADGGVYEGRWSEDNRDGEGTMRYKNGGVYEGEWIEDNRDGKGTMRYENGDVYEGRWSDDMRYGEGTMRYADGDVYEGKWWLDSRHGYGIMLYDDGDVHEGEWCDDMI